MNQIAQLQEQAASKWAQQYPNLAAKGIDEPTWMALSGSVYPGAKQESIMLAVDYCRANKLDVLQKPVHLVPMNVKNAQTNNYECRDVVMPGVGLYRIQASRGGDYAGADAPIFGPMVEREFKNKGGQKVTVSFPESCTYTVYKMIGGNRVAFTATEYWEENYATDSSKSDAPNAMWQKRPRGQLAKCTEAQALRRGWPEIGQMPTAEEMEGKSLDIQQVKEMGPAEVVKPDHYPDADFEANFPKWLPHIQSGKLDVETVLQNMASKGGASEEQKQKIEAAANEGEAA